MVDHDALRGNQMLVLAAQESRVRKGGGQCSAQHLVPQA